MSYWGRWRKADWGAEVTDSALQMVGAEHPGVRVVLGFSISPFCFSSHLWKPYFSVIKSVVADPGGPGGPFRKPPQIASHRPAFLLGSFLLLSLIRFFLYLEGLTFSTHTFHLVGIGQGLSHTLVNPKMPTTSRWPLWGACHISEPLQSPFPIVVFISSLGP